MSHRPPDKTLTLRPATPQDLDDITTVAQQGFPDDPEFDYRFPYREVYPEDNWKWIRKEYQEYFEQPEKYAVVIVTASDNDDKAVALSVWDLSISMAHRGSDLGIPDDPAQEPRRRDADPAHFRHFKRNMDAAFEKYFSQYGDDQVHLWLLCTHPSFRRRGAATLLCGWGLDRASEQGQPATVLASPMGKRLYEAVGFRLDGTFVIGIDGEEEQFTYWALTKQHQDRIAGQTIPEHSCLVS